MVEREHGAVAVVAAKGGNGKQGREEVIDQQNSISNIITRATLGTYGHCSHASKLILM